MGAAISTTCDCGSNRIPFALQAPRNAPKSNDDLLIAEGPTGGCARAVRPDLTAWTGESRWPVSPSRPRAAGRSTIPSWEPSRSPTRIPSAPEFYEIERKAIFKRAWLNVGRVEQLPRKGSYFTKELKVANTSIIVVRTTAGEVKAYHNICRHRGNKLVWNDMPLEETSGVCRQFTCKYHAWRYDLDGNLTFVQQEGEFFDLDKSRYGLVPRALRGLGRASSSSTSPSEPEQSLRDFLGPMITGLEGYPFGKMTSRFYYRSEVKANWKLYMDAFQEFYHAPVLHANQSPTEYSKAAAEAGFEAPHYRIDGPHRLVSTSGIRAWEMDSRDAQADGGHLPERPVRAVGQTGSRRDAAGLNPAKCDPWGLDSFQLFPNFVILIWGQGWYLTYHYWPTSYNTHVFEGTLYFPPPRTPRERIAQELAAVSFKEYGLQDANTLEATQTMIESRVRRQVPALRPGGADPPPAQGDRRVGRRLPAQDGGGDDVRCDTTHAAPRIRRPRAVFGLVPADRAGALREAAGQFDGRDAGLLRRHHAARRGGDLLLRQVLRSTTCRRTCST